MESRFCWTQDNRVKPGAGSKTSATSASRRPNPAWRNSVLTDRDFTADFCDVISGSHLESLSETSSSTEEEHAPLDDISNAGENRVSSHPAISVPDFRHRYLSVKDLSAIRLPFPAYRTLLGNCQELILQFLALRQRLEVFEISTQARRHQ